MKRHFILYPLLLVAILTFTGCSTVSDASKSLVGLFGGNDASAQEKEAPVDTYAVDYQLPLDIYTGTNLNAGSSGLPLGLVIKIYQLKDYRRFERASLQDFLDKQATQTALSDDLITSQEINVVPGQSYHLVTDMRKGANYLGIVALFRSPAKKRWRVAFDAQESRDSSITIGLNACAMTVTRGELVTKFPGQAGSLSMVQCPE